MDINFFTGVYLEIENSHTFSSAVVVEGKSRLFLRDHSHTYAPMNSVGPKNIEDGKFGNSLLVESAQTNLVLDGSFEGLI